jgi:hypothetical protein
MSLKANLQGTGASYGHSHAICGELAAHITAAGSTQATAFLLERKTRHIVTAGTGGVIVPPGVGRGDALQEGDEIEITNATLADISIYPPAGSAFLGYLTNGALTLSPNFSVSIFVDSATRLISRYYQVNSGIAGSGTVTSVALAAPSSILSVSGSPVTSAGTLTLGLQTQTANTVWAGPLNGAAATPTFRALTAADFPALTSGSALLYGNGSGGFSNAAIGSGLSFVGGTLSATGSGGTVTSVGLSMPSIITVSGSPVTGSGTLTGALATQNANTIFAGPTNGTAAQPTFRAMVAADLVNNGANPTATIGASAVNGSATTWMRSDAAPALGANFRTADISFVIDGGGSAITTGIKGDLQINFDCTIQANTVLLDQSGSIVIDVWKDTYANYPPTVADTICASALPTVSSATKSTDSTLTGWTTTIAAGDTLRFNVNSVTSATRALLNLKVIKT